MPCRRLLSPFFSLFTNGRVLDYVKTEFPNEPLQVAQIWTRGSVVALFADAGREMNNDLVLANSFPLLDLLSKVVELTMHCSAIAASAGHIECSEGLVFGISLMRGSNLQLTYLCRREKSNEDLTPCLSLSFKTSGLLWPLWKNSAFFILYPRWSDSKS